MSPVSSAATSAIGTLHRSGVIKRSANAHPGPTAPTSGSRLNAPPQLVKYIVHTSAVRVSRRCGANFLAGVGIVVELTGPTDSSPIRPSLILYRLQENALRRP